MPLWTKGTKMRTTFKKTMVVGVGLLTLAGVAGTAQADVVQSALVGTKKPEHVGAKKAEDADAKKGNDADAKSTEDISTQKAQQDTKKGKDVGTKKVERLRTKKAQHLGTKKRKAVGAKKGQAVGAKKGQVKAKRDILMRTDAEGCVESGKAMMKANIVSDYACMESEKPGVWEITPYLERSWLVGPKRLVQGKRDIAVYSGAYADCKLTGRNFKRAGVIAAYACEKDERPDRWELTPYFNRKR
ncbi:hypothetical protein [Streptomyces sp. 3N207]|uniref:hypothetical protein n=1 Tax=Streptomyces sp. 3N207 TaxID=3457417 RepID=UPI003FD05145